MEFLMWYVSQHSSCHVNVAYLLAHACARARPCEIAATDRKPSLLRSMKLSCLACLLWLAACADVADPEIETVDRSLPCQSNPLLKPVVHTTDITGSQIWVSGSTHIIKGNIAVRGSVQIAACARVALDQDASLSVPTGGVVYALTNSFGYGAAFNAYGSSPWSQLIVNGGFMSLVNASIGGGGVANQGELAVTSGTLVVQNTVITDAIGYGLDVGANATIDPSSTGLAIQGAAAPVRVVADLVHEVPAGSYTGNGNDAIVISVPGHVQTTQVWPNQGVPYQVGDGTVAGSVQVFDANGGLTTLTVRKGVEMRFTKNTSLMIEPDFTQSVARGALYAVGTQAEPIAFTSAQASPQPGDWTGLWFGATTDQSNLSYAGVFYAGGPSGLEAGCPTENKNAVTDGAIELVTDNGPMWQFMSVVVIEHSASNGIVRGWRGNPGVDYTAPGSSVLFSGIGQCRESFPKPPSGLCPAMPTPGC